VGSEAIQTSDSSYVTSSLYGTGIPPDKATLIKINTVGDTLWTRQYVSTASTFGIYSTILLTNDGGFLLVNAAIIKTDASGNPLWAKSNGAIFEGAGAVESPNGDLCAVGFTMSPTGSQVAVIKLDASGNTIFSNTYGGAGHDRPKCIQRAVAGGYIIGGNSSALGTDNDALLIRMDDAGNVTWAKSYGFAGQDGFFKVHSLPDGSFLAMGINNVAPGANTATFLMKIDANGNIIWSKSYREMTTEGYGMSITPDNRILIAGRTAPPPYGDKAMIINCDSSGNVIWLKKYDPISSPYLNIFSSIDATMDGGYILTGNTSDTSVGYFYINKTDSNLDNSDTCTQSTAPLTAQNIIMTAVNYPMTPIPDFVINETVTMTSLDSMQTVTVCTSVGITENEEQISFEMYPNPVTESLTIHCDTHEFLDVIIYDMAGREQLRQPLKDSGVINMKSLHPGLYLVNVVGNTVNAVRKIYKHP